MNNMIINREEIEEVVRISSREVATMMGISRHADLIKKIDKINEVLNNEKIRSSNYWIESKYNQEGNGKENKEYLVSKDGCQLLAHKSTGEKGILFTVKYMEKFNEMEQELERIKNTPSYEIENKLDRARAWIKEQEEIELAKENAKRLEEDNKAKQNVIDIVSEDINVADNRQRLNEIIKSGVSDSHAISKRWNKLYAEYEKLNHIDINKRLNNHNKLTRDERFNKNKYKNKINSRIDYIDIILNDIDGLCELAAKLFGQSILKLVNDLYGIRGELNVKCI